MKSLLAGLCTLVVGLTGLVGQDAVEVAKFPVEHLSVTYGRSYPDAPPLETVSETEVTLFRSGDDLSAEGSGAPVTFRLVDPLPAGTHITESGLQRILAATVERLNAGGVYGVVAFPSRDQIDLQTKEDVRAPDDKSLRIVVWLTEVAEVRTIGKGERLGERSGVMSPMHIRIRENSPLMPPAEGRSGSLIFKEELDEYLRRLNRHPGRRVEAAISSTDQPGQVVLDYLVSENRPWFAYAQVSNTGTEATNELRERFGFVHNQLFNRDDILSIDFITANFDEANAAFFSYDIPVIFPDKLRTRAFGSWGDYDASVRLASPISNTPGETDFTDERFTGESYSLGAELTWNPLQVWGASIDVAAGLAMSHYEVLNLITAQQGSADLVTPYITLGAERIADYFQFATHLGYEWSGGDSGNDLTGLGRSNITDEYGLVRFDLNVSGYLDAIFGKASPDRTIGVHEGWAQIRLQTVLGDDRLIPQKEQTVGGFFSVRGYAESAAAGDNTTIGNFEYRFHLPRALRPASEINMNEGAAAEPAPTLFGRPFNYRPPRVTARPDWDLILRAFFDYGRVEINDPSPAIERDHTLMSVGVGLELQLMRYINARVDYGYVLEDLKTGVYLETDDGVSYTPGPNDTDKGDSRLHFLITFVW